MTKKEYIDREAVMKIIDDYGTTHGSILGSHSGVVDIVGNIIFHLPVVDVTQIVHGEWTTNDGVSRCSKCGYIPPYDNTIDDIFYSNYYPNCGAKMNEDD